MVGHEDNSTGNLNELKFLAGKCMCFLSHDFKASSLVSPGTKPKHADKAPLPLCPQEPQTDAAQSMAALQAEKASTLVGLLFFLCVCVCFWVGVFFGCCFFGGQGENRAFWVGGREVETPFKKRKRKRHELGGMVGVA